MNRVLYVVACALAFPSRYSGDDEDVHAEIHYLTPSAWEGSVLGGLSTPAEDYHPHYITHEVVHFFQWACCHVAAREEGYRWPTGTATRSTWICYSTRSPRSCRTTERRPRGTRKRPTTSP